MSDLETSLRAYARFVESQHTAVSVESIIGDPPPGRRRPPWPTRDRQPRRWALLIGSILGLGVLLGATLAVVDHHDSGVSVKTVPSTIPVGPSTTAVAPTTTPAASSTTIQSLDTFAPAAQGPVTPRVLFTHRAPSGNTVTARAGTVTLPCTWSPLVTDARCGTPGHQYATGPGVEFDYVISGQRHRSLVLDDDPRAVPGPGPTGMAALFASPDPTYPDRTTQDLVILRVGAQVALVRLTTTGPAGAAPDQMTPVDGWVSFPVRSNDNVSDPQAFDTTGRPLGSALPYPCC